MFRAWERVNEKLPDTWRDDKESWKNSLFSTFKTRRWPDRKEQHIPNTKEVYQMRKKLQGLVIGPLDKNNGELWVCCPTLYHRALEKMHCEKAGYDKVFTAKLSAHRRRKYTVEELPEQIIRTTELPRNQRGGERDIVEVYRKIYKKRGWDRYAAFNRQGGFNQPYILFKEKNVRDPNVRKEKWDKVRPIAATSGERTWLTVRYALR